MQVHDPGFDEEREAQQVFRQVLDAMAWPGKVNRLPAARVEPPAPWPAPLVQVARTLLDGQVRFAVHGEGAEKLARYLAANTGARQSPLGRAGYVLAGHPLGGLSVQMLFPGTLMAPETGATLLVACSHVGGGDGGPTHMLRLWGRGVTVGRTLRLDPEATALLLRLAAREDEYPLGIDVILIDPAGHVVGLPRTTHWREEAREWATSR